MEANYWILVPDMKIIGDFASIKNLYFHLYLEFENYQKRVILVHFIAKIRIIFHFVKDISHT